MIGSSTVRGTVAAIVAGGLLVTLAGVTAGQDASPGAGTAAPSLPTIEAPASLVTPGVLSDCVDIEYPPMEYFPSPDITDPAQAVGFDVDAARAVAQVLGLQLDIKNTGFQALIPDLQAGRCDIVWSALFINETRLEVADAVPYLQTGHQIMVPAGNPEGITGPESLCGKAVAIQGGGLVEERITQASADCEAAGQPAISIQAYATVPEEFQQIVLGRVAAIWETETAVREWMSRNPDQYEVAYELPKDVYGIYYGKGKDDLGAALAAALKALKDAGVMEELALKYDQDPVSLEAIQ
jgi:polar amino acid transport system substrate-binding protein